MNIFGLQNQFFEFLLYLMHKSALIHSRSALDYGTFLKQITRPYLSILSGGGWLLFWDLGSLQDPYACSLRLKQRLLIPEESQWLLECALWSPEQTRHKYPTHGRPPQGEKHEPAYSE